MQLHIHLVSGDSGTGKFRYYIDVTNADGTTRLHILSYKALMWNLKRVFKFSPLEAKAIEQATWQNDVVLTLAS